MNLCIPHNIYRQSLVRVKVKIVKRFLERFARRAASRGEHVLRGAVPLLVRDLHAHDILSTRVLMCDGE